MIATATPMISDSHKTKNLLDSSRTEIHRDAHLILFDQGFPSKYYPLTQQKIRIGSAIDNDIHCEDPYVSSRHCTIEKRGELYFLKDEESRNGTFLNNILIKETSLTHKAHLRIGKTLLEFEYKMKEKSKSQSFEKMISISPLMRQIFQSIKKIGPSRETVIIYGETGTGKELVAHAIHRHSDRRKRPFVIVNCGAIPTELLESELFGHIKGAFTGAHEGRSGFFQAAEGGTLFLDEIGELPLSLQPKLLRALENREIKPVGAEKSRHVDVRIIAATHQDLPKKVEEGSFRSDLFYRLHLIPLYLPALRDRKEDIPLLINHFTNGVDMTSKALKLLLHHNWPGNIREFKNTLERIKVFLETPFITEKEVQHVLKSPSQPFSETIHEMEKNLIGGFLEKNQWNRTATARALSMPKTTLLDKIKKYNITPKEKPLVAPPLE